MLLSTDAISIGTELLSSEDFYKPAHGQIFAAIARLYESGQPADAVTVADELDRAGLMSMDADPAALVSLQANTPSSANATYYAGIVQELAILRRLIGASGEISDLAYSAPDDVAGGHRLGRADDPRRRRAPQRRDRPLARRAAPRVGRLDRGARQGPHHRDRNGLHRPRQHPARPAALEPHDRRRASVDGQDELRARDPHPRGRDPAQARAAVQPRDEPPRALPAPARLRGARRRPAHAHGPARRLGLAEGEPGDHAARRGERSSSTTTRTSRSWTCARGRAG